MISTLLIILAAAGAELEATYDAVIQPDEKPELRILAPNHPATLWVECLVGEQTLSWEFPEVPAKSRRKVALPRRPELTSARCQVLARFANGHTEGVDVAMSWRYAELDQEGDPAKSHVDLAAHTAILPASFVVHAARIQALDAEGATLFDERSELNPRSGSVRVYWRSPGAEDADKLLITLMGEDDLSLTYDIELRIKR